MWCCSSCWGEWHARRRSALRLIGLWRDGLVLSPPPRRLVLPSVCPPPPFLDHPSVPPLTGSVPVCLPRYLIPCNHMMLSQRRVVRERDCYSVSAAKILALTPSCCSPDRSPPPLRQLDSILFSKGAETPNSTRATGKRDILCGLLQLGSCFYFIALDIISGAYYDNISLAKVVWPIWEQGDSEGDHTGCEQAATVL